MSGYTITSVEKITRSTLLVSLQHEDGAPILFQPGQYAAINGYRNKRPMPVRCFSIVSSPTEQDVLQFSMRVRGKFTTALSGLNVGDRVDVQGPYGGFVLNTHLDQHVVLLAGGIGITPFMSMLRFVDITKAPTTVDLLYSSASQDDIPFGDEIVARASANALLRPLFVVDQGDTNKYSKQFMASGRVTDEVIKNHIGEKLSDVNTAFYICGPPPFMNAVLKTLQGLGVPKNRIRTEAFSQGPNRQTGKVVDWPFSMYAMGAASMSLASFAILIADIAKSVPSDDSIELQKRLTAELSTNNRQADLDDIIASMPSEKTSAKSSTALKKAIASAKKRAQQSSGSTSSVVYYDVPSSSGSSSTSSGSNTPSTPSTPSTPTTPTTPVCTTSQSGVKTCV
ncbi:MAG TPA: FAD-dependent oxidoreductase [Candidatus Saccharibacteria bacterium]|nr:FAD-dependent oxidoreductase [Candidatus Saccharibacteria bacterium]